MIDERLGHPTPIERLVRPFQEIAKLKASSGILLIACTVVALFWANSPWATGYFHLWHSEITLGVGGSTFTESLHFWINDGLMVLFFLVVGLEIKRELLVGELTSFGKAALPIAAALGGMVVPAAVYFLINRGGPGAAGWGIPMATDIAFALGVLALLGSRVPAALKIFLTALAIADDIGAVLVIAFFYTDAISWVRLGVAGVFFLLLIVLNRAGARKPLTYVLLGLGLWICFLHSGIHPTVAGVLLAITIPARRPLHDQAFLARSDRILSEFQSAEKDTDQVNAEVNKSEALRMLANDCAQAQPLMLRFEYTIAPWIKYLVMPLFALSNAGVAFGSGAARELIHPVGLGIIFGLTIGKPVAIFCFSWLATALRFAKLPDRVNWRQIMGVGLLGGIGFTMSLFMADLAFNQTPILETAKVGILAASFIAAVGGVAILFPRSE